MLRLFLKIVGGYTDRGDRIETIGHFWKSFQGVPEALCGQMEPNYRSSVHDVRMVGDGPTCNQCDMENMRIGQSDCG